jgi:hypothetical protein
MSSKEKGAAAHRGSGVSARQRERFGATVFIDGEERAEASDESA